MSDNTENYTFYFKIAYTERTCYYTFPSNITIKNFIEKIKYDARSDFQIPENQEIEIVPAGQIDNINGHHAEMALALELSEYTLREIYLNKWRLQAFYIRLIPNLESSNYP